MSFWVDEIVENIIKERAKDSYLINDSTTPSGHSHIGALRGIILHEIIQHGLDDKKKKTVFQFGFDDFDPMDGRPVYVDESFEQYMGKPLCDIPAPDGVHQSFAEQYLKELVTVIKYLQIEPVYYFTSKLYRAGAFNEAIKIVLDNAPKIRAIYKEVSGSDKGEDWYPLNVVCPKCGKIGTTKVIGWDGKVVKFECVENLVEWAKGCGEKGEISPFDGQAKMPYKVEWPAKWFSMGIDMEGAGKDHAAAGGTRDVANRIYREVFSKTPPYDAPYEFFLIGGKKMKSSVGSGATAKNMADLLPNNLLRFLMIRTKAKRAIEFNPEGETIALLYDEYDRCAEEYLKDPKSDLGRAYYYSKINDDETKIEYRLRFSKIANFLQMPRMDILEYAKEEKLSEAKSRGAVGDEGAIKLSESEKQEIENRIEVAKKWLESYAPESVKFKVQDELPEAAQDLNDIQKQFLSKIADAMSQQDKWVGEALHEKIHAIKSELNIPPRDAFCAIYKTFLGKDSGPQAGWLLASLDQDFVIKRLKEIV